MILGNCDHKCKQWFLVALFFPIAFTDPLLYIICLLSLLFQVRAAKGSGASKEEIGIMVAELLKLKTDYKTLTGKDPVQSTPQQCKYSHNIELTPYFYFPDLPNF